MQTRSRLLHDLTRVAGGAVSTAVGMKDEVEALLRHRLERLVQTLDLATREEMEALRDVAVRAREEQERLNERVAALEKRLESRPTKPARRGAPTDGPAAAPRPARKRATAAKRQA